MVMFAFTAAPPIQDGWYTGVITASSKETTKGGDGEYLSLTVVVTQGQYSGEAFFDLLNVINPNPAAEAIARKQLSKYCSAMGIASFQDTEQLHNIPFEFRGAWVPSKDPQYPDTFKIKDVRPILGPGAAQAQQQFAQPMPQATGGQGQWTPPAQPQSQPQQQPAQWTPPQQPPQQNVPPQQQQQWQPPPQPAQAQQAPPQAQQQGQWTPPAQPPQGQPPVAKQPPW